LVLLVTDISWRIGGDAMELTQVKRLAVTYE
jgi:hypothetical protein